MHVIYSVLQHPCRQRSQRPICFLRMFVKLDTEEAFNQRTQTEFADSKQPRRNDRVEDFPRRKIQAAPQHPQIVIGGVQNNFSRFQRLAQRFQIEIAQGINNEIANRLTVIPSEGEEPGKSLLRQFRGFDVARMTADGTLI